MTGADIVTAAAEHLGEHYTYGAKVPCGVPWRGPWECGALTTYVAFKVTGRLWGCVDNDVDPRRADAYSGAWARDARALPYYDPREPLAGGLVATSDAARWAGAVLIRAPHPDAGVGGHVAISDGEGGTVEAYSTARGVIRSVVGGRRWDLALLLPGVSYAAMPSLPSRSLLVHGSRGPDVARLQAAIGVASDGIFGRDTTRAVVAWQAAHGLVADGEVGPATWAALFPGGS